MTLPQSPHSPRSAGDATGYSADLAALRDAAERNLPRLIGEVAATLRGPVTAALSGSEADRLRTRIWLGVQAARVELALQDALDDLARLAAFGTAP